MVSRSSTCSGARRSPRWSTRRRRTRPRPGSRRGPRLTPSSGVPRPWVISAARRIVPSPPMTTPARSRGRRLVVVDDLDRGSAPGRGRARRPRRPAPAPDAVAVSDPCTNARAPRASSGGRCGPAAGRARGSHAGRRSAPARSRVHPLTRDPQVGRSAHLGGDLAAPMAAGPGAATGRTRRCPTARAAGSTVTPGTPARAGGRLGHRRTASARSSGSRTTPPLPPSRPCRPRTAA
jgi:hypothetical protein